MDSAHDIEELSAYLAALERDKCYRVERVLKNAPHEATELVFFVGENGAEAGPFVRKRIDANAGIGKAYDELFRAQREGRRFRFLPRIFDCHTADGTLVVVMEHIEGRTLLAAVCEDGPSLDLARRVFPLLCDAVAELHEGFDAPIVHRDLKPSNVILTGRDLAVIDFGIARRYRDGADADTASFGTRAYAPPEQFGFGQTDVRSDIYALGMILYYCLTERTPSPSAGEEARSDPAIPSEVSAVIVRATAFDPASRYPSARELKGAFLRAAGESRVGAACAAVAAGGEAGSAVPGMRNAADAVGPARTEAEPQPSPGALQAEGAAASPPADPSKTSTSALSRAVTIMRNVIAVGAWALFFAVSTSLIVDPDEAAAATPLVVRVMRYYGCAMSFFTASAYFLLDRRAVGRRIPLLKARSWKVNLAIGSIALFVCFAMAALSTTGAG